MLGLAENVQKSYLYTVSGLARHCHRSPDQISALEVQGYLLSLHQQRRLSWRSCNAIRHGSRFFYRITMGWPERYFYVPGAKETSKLPYVLSHQGRVRLFTVTPSLKQRALLMTTCSVGLRASEATHLKVADIDSQRRCIRVEQSKGRLDRYVPLSPRLLAQLRDHWRRYRPTVWLFPGHPQDRPMSLWLANSNFTCRPGRLGI